MPGKKHDGAGVAPDVAFLEAELSKALELNAHLKEQLVASQLLSVRMQGALYKYTSYPVGLFNSPWTEGFFTLHGSMLKYFRSEKEGAVQPRLGVEVTGSNIEWEGLKQGRYWTFGLKDLAGCHLIRLSSENRAVAEKWIEALEGAGATPADAALGHANFSQLDRTTSAPPSSTAIPHGRKPNHSRNKPSLGSFEELVDSPTPPPSGGSGGGTGATPRSGVSRKGHGSDSREGSLGGSVGSNTSEAETAQHAKKYSPMLGSTPLHKEETASILSTERLALVPHPGLVNLGVVVLVATNFRLILENMFKYGVLFNPLRWVEEFFWGSFQPLMLCWPVLGACVLAALGIEIYGARRVNEVVMKRRGLTKKFGSNKKQGSRQRRLSSEEIPEAAASSHDSMKRFNHLVVLCHIMITLACLMGPLYFVSKSEGSIAPCFVVTLCTLTVWMKLVSFAHCNYDLRQARLNEDRRPGERDSMHPIEGADQPLMYPENLTISHVMYFMFAPTLTYQITYPRSGKIRFRWLGRRCLEFIVTLALLMVITDQYIFPAVQNSVASIRERNTGVYVERVLKLSIPVVYAWLCMFYLLFHVWLNILAELLRFGDREFYKDWWNATNLGEYWRMWNMPVHKWMLRTVYYPAVNWGIGRNAAMLLVFFVSAVFHEVAVAVPLKLTRAVPWSFLGILAQVPMIFISQSIQKQWGDRFGNVIFWVSFCVIGQPICIMSYYYDWVQATTLMN
ncbi:hypothetical protein BSKO_11478 [Bryopsis sp. KO-2023]|nr:hypothetical protein BSKO_11478 [Bryopsis sp. KO-2023]